jgi:hypothetical protein
VVIPQAMAYATPAGLPLEVGLYASLTPMVVYALPGTSRRLSVSVTSTIALLTAAVPATAVSTPDPSEFLVAAGTFQRIHASPLGQILGDERMFPNLQQAVRVYVEQVDETVENRASLGERLQVS